MNALTAAAMAEFGALGLTVHCIPHRTANTAGLILRLEVSVLADGLVRWLQLPVRCAVAFALGHYA